VLGNTGSLNGGELCSRGGEAFLLSTLMGSELSIYRYVVSPSLGYNISLPRDFFPTMPSFDLHCRYALLTYAQCGDLSGGVVGEFLLAMGFKCVIGRENHEDGGVHLHCFVDFGRKRRFRRANVFDVGERHPNISPSKGTPEKGYEYAIKDGDIVFQSLDPIESRGGNSKTVAIWTEITSASDRESFWDLVLRLDPKSAACNHAQLQKFCDWKFAVVPPAYESPRGVTFIGDELDGRADWLSQSGIGLGESPIGMFVPMGGAEEKEPGGARNGNSGGPPAPPLPRGQSSHRFICLTNCYR